jgi:hypothetical protein
MHHEIIEAGIRCADAIALALSHSGEVGDLNEAQQFDRKVLDPACAHVLVYGLRLAVVALGAVPHNRPVGAHSLAQLLA